MSGHERAESGRLAPGASTQANRSERRSSPSRTAPEEAAQAGARLHPRNVDVLNCCLRSCARCRQCAWSEPGGRARRTPPEARRLNKDRRSGFDLGSDAAAVLWPSPFGLLVGGRPVCNSPQRSALQDMPQLHVPRPLNRGIIDLPESAVVRIHAKGLAYLGYPRRLRQRLHAALPER